ncbi:MAG: hypothetical protein NO516_00575 [Candidatus Methanomethylicia archaeon]|nr:hypothetical protein [Candidatus Methanomethylicia archaeon]
MARLRYIGLFARNIKDAYSVIRELRRLKVPFVLLGDGDKVPRHVRAVIGCGGAMEGVSDGRWVEYGGDPRRTALRALSLATGKLEFKEVVVGVDPGKRAGIATIADGELIEAYAVPGESLQRELLEILGAYPASKILFRIGTGMPMADWMEGFALACSQSGNASVQFVDEGGEKPPTGFMRKGIGKDAKSAVSIALSGGITSRSRRAPASRRQGRPRPGASSL